MNSPRHTLILLSLLALLAPWCLKAQSDTLGVYCPMEFNNFSGDALSTQLLQSVERNTVLPGLNINGEVQDLLYNSDNFYGDEIEAIDEIAKTHHLRMVLFLVFKGNHSEFTLYDPLHPEDAESISASLPEDITSDEFEDLFNQVTSILLSRYVASNSNNLPNHITKL